MNKHNFSYYFSVGTNAFAWQCIILGLFDVIFGTGMELNSYSVLQCCCVGFLIAVLMFFTDKLTAKSALFLKILVDLTDVFLVVLVLGGIVFKWFEFVLNDLLFVSGVIIAVYIIVFTVMWFKAKIASEKINKKIREMNGNENSN